MEILFVICKKCRGKGKVYEGRISIPCTNCEGKGHVMTKLGEHLQIYLSMFCRNIEDSNLQK